MSRLRQTSRLGKLQLLAEAEPEAGAEAGADQLQAEQEGRSASEQSWLMLQQHQPRQVAQSEAGQQGVAEHVPMQAEQLSSILSVLTRR